MSFDRIAPYYRWMENVIAGPLLHQCRTAYLREAAQAQRALLLGDGPGRYLVELLRLNPSVEVTCVDASAPMLAAARQSLAAAGLPEERVTFVCADALAWTSASAPFDWIASHFFLDCFPASPLAELISNTVRAASPSALWVISDFRQPAAGWQRLRARIILKIAYGFFHWATALEATALTAPDPFLEQAGFRLTKKQIFNHGLLYAALWQRDPASQVLPAAR